MNKPILKLIRMAAVAAVLSPALPGFALTLISTTPGGHRASATVQTGALPTIASDIGFNGFGAVSFLFEIGSADVDRLAGFNAVIARTNGADISALQLSLDRGSFAWVGSVVPAFGVVDAIAGDSQRQRIGFAPAEPYGIDLGNPFSAAGAQDWLIGFAGMAAGDRFRLTVSAVPEPAAWALLLAGGAFVAGVRRWKLPQPS